MSDEERESTQRTQNATNTSMNTTVSSTTNSSRDTEIAKLKTSNCEEYEMSDEYEYENKSDGGQD